ncbi:fructosamine kinase [Mariniphaga sediminis]|uniref:Fructosamine kinase n=1 Tax=Mariniphaga sediminis TaxID=1628158 RepID=A0A399CTM4_9BACT|nr:fructosamine kinase family protein [Mariniphaga sediminis]RIH63265.1 fructosamine kinase [Mariniphaga sediminis]
MKFIRNDHSIEKEVESHLSDKFGKAVEINSSGSLGGGCINNASKIETNAGTFFLKWNGNCASDIFLREAESLEELRNAASGQLAVPKVFAAKEVNGTPGFLVLEYLEPGWGKGNSDEKLGRGLATIHRFSSEKFGFYNDNYCGSTPQNNSWHTSWPEFFRDNRLRYLLGLIRQERSLPASEMKVYEQLLERIPELIPGDCTPVLIHGDLWSGNYMNTANGPALIDPASYYANYEMEMGIMTMFGGFSQRFYSAYNEVNPLPAGWRERNSLYQLYHVLNHYYLFGGGYGSQAFHIAKSYL